MSRTVHLNELEEVLADLTYPIANERARDELDDVTIELADGEADFGELLDKSGVSTFDSREDIESELHNVLPRGAVGEPYQSEGEG